MPLPGPTAESRLVVGGLLVAVHFRGRLTWCAWQWRRRGGYLVEEHLGYAASQAPEFRFWGAMLALIGLNLFVLACVLGVRAS